jgi:hypothetical protein
MIVINKTKIHPITINSTDNGYIVSVGCKTFVFQDKQDLLNELGIYLAAGSKYETDLFGKTCDAVPLGNDLHPFRDYENGPTQTQGEQPVKNSRPPYPADT